MTGVNKLQLVNGSKLNAVLELIKKDMETKQMLNAVEKPDNFILEGKKMKWGKKNNDRQGEHIVEFIKNKNSLKRKIEEGKKNKKGPEKKIKLQEIFSNRLEAYFKNKNFKEQGGRIKIGRAVVNKQDLIHDLTHMAAKPGSFNLSSSSHKIVLKGLKKTGMAVNYIRNPKLRDIYKNDGDNSSSTEEIVPESPEDVYKRYTTDIRGIRRGRRKKQ